MCMLAEVEQALAVCSGGTHVWRDRRFVRWWDPMIMIPCSGIAGVASVVLGWAFLGMSRDIGQAAWPLHPWSGHALVIFCSITLYVLLFIPLYFVGEWQLRRAVDRHDSCGQMNEQSLHGHKIVEEVLSSTLFHRRRLAETVHEHDSLHADAGLSDRRVSLVVEEGRCRPLAQSPRLSELASRSLTEVAIGESEPVAIPVVLLRWESAAVMMGTLILVLLHIAMITSVRGAWWLQDVILAFTPLVCYAAFREMGLFPLGLWRGECSSAETKVLHRFRWKVFQPGRDLAVLRFRSDREADVALIGANGDHAVARVGGRYLDHFIACWACRAIHAGGSSRDMG